MLDSSFPDHDLELRKNYVACKCCGQMTLRHSSLDKLSLFVRRTCWNEEWNPPLQWQGQLSHKLWRKGNKVACTFCGGNALCSEQGFLARARLKKCCRQKGVQARGRSRLLASSTIGRKESSFKKIIACANWAQLATGLQIPPSQEDTQLLRENPLATREWTRRRQVMITRKVAGCIEHFPLPGGTTRDHLCLILGIRSVQEIPGSSS